VPINYTGTNALITGASSGLGAEFAEQLAARGANLILVARRVDRLEALARTLTAKYGVAATALAADLTAAGAASDLATRVEALGLPVHTLINNAGFGAYGRFEDEDAENLHNEVTLNVTAVVELSRAFYPELSRHGSGALVNVASTAAFQPVPLMAVYGASKAFVLSFTEALWYEAKSSGLRVIALCPGGTRTEFFDTAGEAAHMGSALQTPQRVVRVALRALDRRNPPPSVISGFANTANTVFERFVPRRIVASAVGGMSLRSGKKRPATSSGTDAGR